MQRAAIFSLLSVALGVSACAYYDDVGYGYGPAGGARFGDYMYAGGAYDRGGWDEGAARVQGPGAHMLDPWLALTSEGRDILALGFNAGENGYISEEMAERANVWFRRHADHNRDMRLTDEEIRVALVHSSRG